MAFPAIFETNASQEGSIDLATAALTREYIVLYQSNPVLALQLVQSTAPTTWNPTGSYNVDVKQITWRNFGMSLDCWIFRVIYGSSKTSGNLRPDQLSVRIGYQNAHITQSIQTVQRISTQDLVTGGTNLTVDAATNTDVLPDGYTPQAADVGHTITVVSGSGFTPGNYTVNAIVTVGGVAKWQLSASPAAVGTSGGVWTKANNLPTGTNLTVDAVTNTKVTPDGYTPVSGDVGRQIYVIAGTSWTVGLYTITAVGGGEWTLNSSPAATSTSGGDWYMVGTAPQLNGAIGQNLDTVQGADVPTPNMEFSLSQAYSTMSLTTLASWRALVGKTNKATFNGIGPGQLIYLGAEQTSPQGSFPPTAGFNWFQFAHAFRYVPDLTNVQLGPITIPYLLGAGYTWARYGPTVPAGNNPILAQTPQYVYVEQVSGLGDFSTLGITL